METCSQKSHQSDSGSVHIWILIAPIRAYRYLLSPWLGHQCRFEPSCSVYAEQALQRFGVLRGSYLAICRLLKCHPWHHGGFDPIPETSTKQHMVNK